MTDALLSHNIICGICGRYILENDFYFDGPEESYLCFPCAKHMFIPDGECFRPENLKGIDLADDEKVAEKLREIINWKND